ncbi:jacalin-like lectin [Burkholderia sp. Ac-20365]|uniref:jacalin-like lectin n=1 Tax=Burkholderia sp. Ac-20365 TaxID=2703897 RepID=UPI00197B734D|nr:jacalin-like lectin [Burkholderia sp. Ac-20365]MBN3761165.1 hypothetical protein [Burkholderia sp. Ac-20365]
MSIADVLEPVEVLAGFDSFVGSARTGRALDGGSLSAGQSSGVQFYVCENSEKLMQSLDIEQSASAQFGPIGGADEKVSLYHSLNVTTFSISIVLRAWRGQKEQATPTGFLDGLCPTSGSDADDDALDKFARVYGDRYIASITKGSEFVAVYTFYSRNSIEKTNFSASLSANGIFDGATVDAQLQQKITSFLSTNRIVRRYASVMKGVDLTNVTPPTPETLIPFALKFSTLPAENPATISYETDGYEHVAGCGDITKLIRNRNYFLGEHGLLSKLKNLQELRSQIQRIQAVHECYGGFADEALVRASTLVEGDIDSLQQQIDMAEQHPTVYLELPSLPSLDLGTPELDFEIPPYKTLCGGVGGNPYTDFDRDQSVPNRQRLAQIDLHAWDWVDSLVLQYEADGGDLRQVFHGNFNNGHLLGVLQLGKGEFVNHISAMDGGPHGCVRYVQIGSSGGNVIKGGTGNNPLHEWQAEAGEMLIGFTGRSGEAIDQIGVVTVKMKECIWHR